MREEETLVKFFRNTRTFAISAPWDSEGQLKKSFYKPCHFAKKCLRRYGRIIVIKEAIYYERFLKA